LEDWGARLDPTLYRDVITHFLGGESEVVRNVEVRSEYGRLGDQRVHLISPQIAFSVTAAVHRPDIVLEHQRRFIQHTSLRAMQWINLSGQTAAVPGEAAIGCFFATWARAFVKLVSEHMFAYKLGLAIMPPAVSGMLGSLDGERNRRGSPSSYRVRQAAQGFVRGFFVSLGPRRLWEAPRPPGPEGHHSSGRRAFLGLRHVLAQGRLVAGLRPTP
jgi:hypothetical protein